MIEMSNAGNDEKLLPPLCARHRVLARCAN
jgi:hypothetical protein